MKLFDDRRYVSHAVSIGMNDADLKNNLDNWVYGQVGRTPEEMIEVGIEVNDAWFITSSEDAIPYYVELHFHNQDEKGMIAFSCFTGAYMFSNAFLHQIATGYNKQVEDCEIEYYDNRYEIMDPERISINIWKDAYI